MVKPQSRYLDINGLRLHYLDWGNRKKEAVLLLHGFMSQAHIWDFFASRLAEHYHVTALDQRGHGLSQWSPNGAYSIDDHFADITRFIETLDLHDVTLIGHSMGGRNALMYAACRPERVKSV